ncbi:MAG: single-stranded DNA-binding protein [Clostridia bacterium]|nr:single-stranded DNA-binding protein [Clostridia bacterium]
MANFNFNKIILGGRLTADVELKQTPSGVSVAQFSVAVNRKYSKDSEQQQTDFFNVTAWRSTAEFVAKYFKKGSSICVVGSLQNRTWEDNNGQKRYATDIIADEVSFVDSKNDSQGTETVNTGAYMPEAYTTSQGNFEGVEDDADLPF